MYGGTPPPSLAARRRDGRFVIPNICTRLRLNARRNCRVLATPDDRWAGTICMTSRRLGAFSADVDMALNFAVATVSDVSRTNETLLSSMSSTDYD